MKRYKNWIIMIYMAILSSACSDMLDEVPLDMLAPENLFQTVEDVEAVTVGMYQGLATRNEGCWSMAAPVNGWGIMGTDIWAPRMSDDGERSRFGRYLLSSAEDQVREFWSFMYSTINRANLILDKVPGMEIDENLKNRYLAEAYFVRSFCYMDLVQFYGGVPLRKKPAESIQDELGLPRSTEEDTWALVIEGFEFAEQYLPGTTKAGRATKWAAKGLLAKSYLTRGGYPVGNYQESEWFEKAAEKAYEVIEQSNIPLNPTTPGSPNAYKEYGSQFLESGENSPESIFEIQFTPGDYGGAWGYRGPNAGSGGWDGDYYYPSAGSTIGCDFALSYDDADIRFAWNISPIRVNNNTRSAVALNAWCPGKFRLESVPPGVFQNGVNAVVLRMADIYLLFAEASNEATGDPNSTAYGMSAYDAINTVRNRAQVDHLNDDYLLKDSPYSGTDLLYGMSLQSFNKSNGNYDGRHVYYTGSLKERFRSAVLMERAWELCFERHRWFDLKRTGNLVEFAGNAHILRNGRLKSATDPIDKSDFANLPSLGSDVWPSAYIQPYNQYIPIPDVEIQLNPEIGPEDQNPTSN
ncbi:MAG: RagB/SusD family nutrient uptake outer membrane protein [Mangrovibacterium sp.]